MLINGKESGVQMGGNFAPVPEDKYTVQVLKIEPMRRFNSFKNKEEDQLNFTFVILDDKPLAEDSTESVRGRYLWKSCTLSYSAKSWLFKILAPIVGRELSKEEFRTFDIGTLVGEQLNIMVEQKPSSDGLTVSNRILTFSKVLKKLPEFTMKTEAKEEKSSTAIDVEEVFK